MEKIHIAIFLSTKVANFFQLSFKEAACKCFKLNSVRGERGKHKEIELKCVCTYNSAKVHVILLFLYHSRSFVYTYNADCVQDTETPKCTTST